MHSCMIHDIHIYIHKQRKNHKEIEHPILMIPSSGGPGYIKWDTLLCQSFIQLQLALPVCTPALQLAAQLSMYEEQYLYIHAYII